jgi:hypothetical protein
MAVHQGSIWLDQNWSRLPPDLWVAADATKVVAEARTIVDLYAALANLQVRLPDVTIAYVPAGVIQ